jgi:5-formyltetrahydrofolate cyclo-ligase
METKEEVRARFLNKRNDLGETERDRLSMQIAGRAVAFLSENLWINHIHVFLPIRKLNEINTWLLIQELFRLEKQVYTSVTDFGRETMHTVRIDVDSKFAEDKFGLPVPIAPNFIRDNQGFDLVFVPLLAFDLKGMRVGYGKGYYDRFFESINRDVRKIGLSYFPPTELPSREHHDVLLDGCILPDQIIYFNK